MVFPYHSVSLCPKSDYDIPENSVIHIKTSFPYNLSCIYLKFIALLDVVVKKRCKKVIGTCYCVKVTCKMKIKIFHRYYLGISSTCGTAFNTKTWSKGWLTKSDGCFLTHSAKCLSKTNRNGCLTFSCRSWIDCSYQYQFSIRVVLNPMNQFVRKLCLILSIEI